MKQLNKLKMDNSTHNAKHGIMGYSLLEFIFVLGIVGVCFCYGGVFLRNYIINLKPEILAKQTKTFARAYLYLIYDKYDVLYNQAKNNPDDVVIISSTSLESYGSYLPKGSHISNIYMQTPCAAIRYNPTNDSLSGVMYYTQGSDTHNTQNFHNSYLSATLVGNSTSVWDDNLTTVSGLGWFMDQSDPLFSNVDLCNSGARAKNSLVVNLEYIGGRYALGAGLAKESNYNLMRVKDPDSDKYPLGDKRNKNTLLTDIALANHARDESGNPKVQYSGIVFGDDPTSSPILTSAANHRAYAERGIVDDGDDESNIVALIGAGFSAGSVTPTGRKHLADACTAPQQGTIVLSSIPSPLVIRSHLVCTFNPWVCNGIDPHGVKLNNYCYLPPSDIQRRYDAHNQAYYNNTEEPYGFIIDGSIQVDTQGNAPQGSGNCYYYNNGYGDLSIIYESDLDVTYNNLTVHRGIKSVTMLWHRGSPWLHWGCSGLRETLPVPTNITAVGYSVGATHLKYYGPGNPNNSIEIPTNNDDNPYIDKSKAPPKPLSERQDFVSQPITPEERAAIEKYTIEQADAARQRCGDQPCPQ